jgi:hypothetical protein
VQEQRDSADTVIIRHEDIAGQELRWMQARRWVKDLAGRWSPTLYRDFGSERRVTMCREVLGVAVEDADRPALWSGHGIHRE